jgi:hypothetical protein
VTEKKFLSVVDGQPIKFSELAHLIALHPMDPVNYGAARVNLDSELVKDVHAGKLVVRNAADMGPHTFPYGESLQGAVILSWDLRPFLQDRGIELRVMPGGCGPNLWTLANAAHALAEQEGWHDGARGSLLDRMQEAAANGDLVVRDPHSDLPYRPTTVRTYYEVVMPSDVNEWLKMQRAPYFWDVSNPLAKAVEPEKSNGEIQTPTKETKEQRRSRRYQMCIDAGLSLPRDDYAHLPAGIKKLAATEGITRQSFAADVKAHIARIRQ